MKKCFVEKVWLEDEGRKIFPDLYEAVYLASDVDTRIAELEKALRASSRWLNRNVLNDVMLPEMMTDTDGFSSEYLNDLADMRAVRELMAK